MREALRALTTRGRAFLAAGGTALICAVALGQDALVRVSLLLLLLPLATAWFLGRSRYRLGLVRTLNPPQVVAGQQATVELDLTNDGKMPTGLLMLEDQVPYVLGTRPRFVIDRMGHKWKRQVGYLVRSDVRGKYTVGPLKVRLSDPFGLVELDRTFQSTSSLVVTPRVLTLPAIPLSGAWTGSGDNRPRAFASGSAEDVTVREYRRGDDLRRVHWRSSAHSGELMVRREEQPWQSRATLFLDNRTFAHRGSGAASSLEHAVTFTASVAVHLIGRGYSVRLITAAGEEEGGWHEHGALSVSTGPLLESLAVIEQISQTHLDVRWLQEGGHSGLLVAVLGAVTEYDRPTLTRMRHSASGGLGICLDVQAWTRSGQAEADTGTATWLNANGWRAITTGPREPVSTVWQDLGLASTSRGARSARDFAASLALGGEPR